MHQIKDTQCKNFYIYCSFHCGPLLAMNIQKKYHQHRLKQTLTFYFCHAMKGNAFWPDQPNSNLIQFFNKTFTLLYSSTQVKYKELNHCLFIKKNPRICGPGKLLVCIAVLVLKKNFSIRLGPDEVPGRWAFLSSGEGFGPYLQSLVWLKPRSPVLLKAKLVSLLVFLYREISSGLL